ncbi:MAG: ComEC/Rec2 family competence protein, partial [Gammaproteobacteria bacterium]
MRKATLAFLLGVVALYPFPDLPDARLGAVALPLLVASIRFPLLRVPAWFALGFAWALLRGSSILAAGLAPALEGEPLVIEGTVAGLPRAYERALNFDMDVAEVTGMGKEWPSPGRVRLSWYGRERILVPGETWRFAVKLKRPHGFMNPGGFDYEGWLFQRRIRALGHVIDSPRNQRLEGARGALVDRLRQRLALKLAGVAGQSSQGNVLTALVIGTQDAIGPEQWQVFNRTGTSHLVSISGLHIGLIALLGFW